MIKSIIHCFSNNSALLESVEVYAAVFKYQFYKAINSSSLEHHLNNWYTVKISYVIFTNTFRESGSNTTA
jgi:hypothetical protein